MGIAKWAYFICSFLQMGIFFLKWAYLPNMSKEKNLWGGYEICSLGWEGGGEISGFSFKVTDEIIKKLMVQIGQLQIAAYNRFFSSSQQHM